MIAPVIAGKKILRRGDVVALVAADTREHARDAWRRFAALMIDAFRAGDHGPLPPPTPADELRSSIAMLTGDTLRIPADT